MMNSSPARTPARPLIPHLEYGINAVFFCLFALFVLRYHKSQAIYLESKDNTKISCVISSVGTNEVSFRTYSAPFTL